MKFPLNLIILELDMRAFDELRRLEMFFKDEDRHGCSVVDLYELVQHAGNILPRLYVLSNSAIIKLYSTHFCLLSFLSLLTIPIILFYLPSLRISVWYHSNMRNIFLW